MKKKFISNNMEDTEKFAKEIAEEILKLPKQEQAVVIGLSGELGSGKTTFTQNFAKAFGIKTKILSPTFVLMKKHQIPISNLKTQDLKFKTLIHIDAYRIRNSKEMLDLGWEAMINNPENIILVEWAENIKNIFPKKNIWFNFFHKEATKRVISFLKI